MKVTTSAKRCFSRTRKSLSEFCNDEDTERESKGCQDSPSGVRSFRNADQREVVNDAAHNDLLRFGNALIVDTMVPFFPVGFLACEQTKMLSEVAAPSLGIEMRLAMT